MTTLRWICLSDLHFGAENSVLSHLPEGSLTVDPTTTPDVLRALVECLRELVQCTDPSARPDLVLDGDVIEFALATDDVAAMAFDRFVDEALATDRPFLGPTLYYVPGNHDHHLWEVARERQYGDYIAKTPPGTDLARPWHTTRLFEVPARPGRDEQAGDHFPPAELLQALIDRRTGGARTTTVRVAYPNLGLHSGADSPPVVFHHGHFIEPLYLLMTQLRLAMFPASPEGEHVWDWEADNFAWIDFFWSTLGRSGEVGADIGVIYDMLQSEAARRWLAGNVGVAVGRRVPGPRLIGRTLSPVLRAGLAALATRVHRPERHAPAATLSPSAAAGLERYVSGPLRRQLLDEHPGAAPRTVTLVLGHTHKPFERTQSFTGFEEPVTLFNTGGWVVDTTAPNPVQGASVVLGDDGGNVAALRLYQQSGDLSSYRVRLAPDPSGRPNPLHQALGEALDLSSDPWVGFSRAVGRAVAQRHRALPAIIRNGMKNHSPAI